jgi:CheY-like chemotaxis protein
MDLQMPVMDGYESMETLRDEATEFQTKPILLEDLHALCNLFLFLPAGSL